MVNLEQIAYLIGEIPKKKKVVLVSSLEEGKRIESALKFFMPNMLSLIFPPWDILPFEHLEPDIDIVSQRLMVLDKIISNKVDTLIVPIPALCQRVISAKELVKHKITLKEGDFCDIEALLKYLSLYRYKRVDLVRAKGQFAHRGYVIDLFSPNYQSPIRVKVLSNKVESIRFFSVLNQLTIQDSKLAMILPASELLPLSEESIAKIKKRALDISLPLSELKHSLALLEKGDFLPYSSWLYPYFSSTQSFVEILIENNFYPIVVNFDKVIEEEKGFLTLAKNEYKQVLKNIKLTSALEDVYTLDGSFKNLLNQKHTLFSTEQLSNSKLKLDPSSLSQLYLKSPNKQKSIELVSQFILQCLRKGFSICLLAINKSRAKRLQELLLNYNLDLPFISNEEAITSLQYANKAVVSVGAIERNFILPQKKIIFICETDTFGAIAQKKAVSLYSGETLPFLGELEEGDYVIHNDYGIGLYQGLSSQSIKDSSFELLKILYEDATLYLPVYQVNKLQKLITSDDSAVKLDKLSSNNWQKKKAKIKKDIESIFTSLFSLYIQRKTAKGFAFEEDSYIEKLFAESFPYEETPDQQRAINDVLKDMSSSTPMDRLICGDVGFGKTEVAARAAFRCIINGKQVAVICPTTVLAQQHYNTFLQRVSEFGIKIGMVSRFNSQKKNKEVLQELRVGNIDIIIGTHRLLQKDVLFNNLGLLIIDEEHRFGVSHKERLTSLKSTIDCLTLSATPIPRTLNMSLVNFRDISIIATPPLNRKAIKTFVGPYEKEIVVRAISRELNRGGQCFYLYNKVRDIERVAQELELLVPEAKIAIAHGQMSEKELENIMMQFLQKQYDILLCTTIIESGIDIPTANTIIIYNAHKLGLAQMYQLRGRVGRSYQQGYCYIFFPSNIRLTDKAKERLEAMNQIDDLNYGFRIAMADLQIRGVGEMLGKKQSGKVNLLEYQLAVDAIKELTEQKRVEVEGYVSEIEPDISINIPAFIPLDNVIDTKTRLLAYRQFAIAKTDQEIERSVLEMEDRFGLKDQKPFVNFIWLMKLRILLKSLAVVRLELKGKKLILALSDNSPIDIGNVIELVKIDKKLTVTPDNLLIYILDYSFNDVKSLYDFLVLLFSKINK